MDKMEEKLEEIFQEGVEKYKEGDYEEASEYFHQVILADLDHPERTVRAWYNKGCCLIQLGRWTEAANSFEQVLKAGDKEIIKKALLNLGYCLAELGKLNEALKCFNKVILLDRRIKEAWWNKAIIFTKQGRYIEALKCFKAFVRLKE